MHLCGLCFLLSLPTLLSNMEGHDMRDFKSFIHTTMLGNVDILQRPAAIMELVISGVLVRCLFWARHKQLAEATAARESEVTPADFSVMLSGLPAICSDAATLKRFVSHLDPSFDVIAASLSVDCADLIRKVNEAALLRSEEHALRAQLYLLRRRQKQQGSSGADAPAKTSQIRMFLNHSYAASNDQKLGWRIEKLQSDLDTASVKVKRIGLQIKEMVALRTYVCTGFAFVTFNEEESAQACIQLIKGGGLNSKGCG